MTKTKWEKSSPELTELFYDVMKDYPLAELRKMFGYPCAFLNGNMVLGLHEENFAVRLSETDREKALASGEGIVFAPMKGRIMREYVALAPEVLEKPSRLKALLDKSYQNAETLPVKKK